MFLLFLIIFVFILTGCSNEQIEQAIEDCKNDSECKLIIDEAIDEELESRGISGGKMTFDELEGVYNIFDRYPVYNSYIIQSTQEFIFNILIKGDIDNFPYTFEEAEKIILEVHEFNKVSKYLNLRDINKEKKQYFIYQNTRYIIYKEGVGRFVIEIQGDVLVTIKIDIELEKLYINDLKVTNEYVNLIDSIFSNRCDFSTEDEIYYYGKNENMYYIIRNMCNNGYGACYNAIFINDMYIYQIFTDKRENGENCLYFEITNNENKVSKFNFILKEVNYNENILDYIIKTNMIDDYVEIDNQIITNYGKLSDLSYMTQFEEIKIVLNTVFEELNNH